jgi:hypothetical protein
LTEEEKVIIGLIPPPSEKKKIDEINKKLKEEDDQILNVAKRPYAGINIYSNFLPQSQFMRVKFQYSKSIEFENIVFYKNEYKVTTYIPGITS